MPILQQSKQGQYEITLPKSVVEAKGWEKGIELVMFFNERGNIEIQTRDSTNKYHF